MLMVLLIGTLIVLLCGAVGYGLDKALLSGHKTKIEPREADFHKIRAMEKDLWGEVYTELPEVEKPKKFEAYSAQVEQTYSVTRKATPPPAPIDRRGPTSPPPKPDDMMRKDGLYTAQRAAARKYWEQHVRGRGFGADVRPFDELPPEFRANLYWQAEAKRYGVPDTSLLSRLKDNSNELAATQRIPPPAIVDGKEWGSGKIAPLPAIDSLEFDMMHRKWKAYNKEFQIGVVSHSEEAAVADMAAKIRTERSKREDEANSLSSILEQNSRVDDLIHRRDELVDMGDYDSARQLNVMIENAQGGLPLTANPIQPMDEPYPSLPAVTKVATGDLTKLIDQQSANHKKARAYYK